MQTLLDFGQEVIKIREAVNSLEVKGEANAALIVYTVQKCNDIILEINNIAKNQNGSEEVNENEQN